MLALQLKEAELRLATTQGQFDTVYGDAESRVAQRLIAAAGAGVSRWRGVEMAPSRVSVVLGNR